jgi:hypothetical protein
MNAFLSKNEGNCVLSSRKSAVTYLLECKSGIQFEQRKLHECKKIMLHKSVCDIIFYKQIQFYAFLNQILIPSILKNNFLIYISFTF